jgi:hypothetical protein
MGLSRNNPLSTAFAGTLPDLLVGGSVTVEVLPSTEFVMRATAFQADPVNAGRVMDLPGPGDWDAVFMLNGSMTKPSALERNNPQRWPTGSAPMGELFRLNFEEFKLRIEDRNPHLKAPMVGTDVPAESESEIKLS